MRETLSKPKPTFASVSGMPRLVKFLNLKFDPSKKRVPGKIQDFFRAQPTKKQIEKAWDVQQGFMQLVAPIAERQPQASRALERLVNALNQWALTNNIHPYWFLSSLDRVRRLEPGQPIMEIGDERWVVTVEPTMRGAVYTGDPIEGRVWTLLAKCFQAGDLDRLRRCSECRRFFFAQHWRQLYCGPQHQKEHDRKVAKHRVRKWRASAQEHKQEEEARAKEREIIQRFADFLVKARGNTNAQMSVGPTIKRIPGGWKTVNGWLKEQKGGKSPGQIWQGLSDQERKLFREE